MLPDEDIEIQALRRHVVHHTRSRPLDTLRDVSHYRHDAMPRHCALCARRGASSERAVCHAQECLMAMERREAQAAAHLLR